MTTIEVPISELKKEIFTALLAVGYPEEDATVMTEVMLFAELRGNNQGIIKLTTGALKPTLTATNITVIRNNKITAKIDGGQRSGMFVLQRMVDMAIEKTKTHGMSAIVANNYSSATGALGIWARKISEAGFIGIVMSQCPEMVAPHGSYEAIFGTNPIAFGIPTSPRPQIFDMATSAEAWFSLVSAKEEGRSIAPDVAYDNKGNVTTDPSEALKGALRSFDRSYKGSHLGLIVELLAGALAGASMEKNKKESMNWGSLIIAIDPAEFHDSLEEFQSVANIMCDRVKNAAKLPGVSEIYLPGERGDGVEAVNVSKGTLEVPQVVYAKLVEIAENK